MDAAIEDAIRTCGGDARVEVGALILGQRSFQEAYSQRISAGYVRRGLRERDPITTTIERYTAA